MTETERSNWTMRMPLMIAVGAIGGLLVELASPSGSGHALREGLTFGLFTATLAFLMTAERQRIAWAAIFALGWGLVIGGVAWTNSLRDTVGDWAIYPIFSGIVAVLVAAPLFQTMRDAGSAHVEPQTFHRYAWSDAIIGGASLAFTGLTFLLSVLVSILFDAIGIDWLKELLNEGWFRWILAGAAFGAASARLRASDNLLGTLQRLVMMVVSVLAPALAIALMLFLIAVPLTGFAGLWRSGLPETPLLLSIAAFAVIFLNALIGDEASDRKDGKLWRFTEYALLFAVLPLGLLAVISMGMRVGQHGLTPERLWGEIAALIALAWGIAAWWSYARGRKAFDGPFREAQVHLAFGLVALGVFLALPILNFASISAKSQLARLESGEVSADKFDWAAMAYDFGPKGRAILEDIKAGDDKALAAEAARVLAVDNRWDLREESETLERMADLDGHVRIIGDFEMTDLLRRSIARGGRCDAQMTCAVMRDGENYLLLRKVEGSPRPVMVEILDPQRLRETGLMATRVFPPNKPVDADLEEGDVEIRTVERRQVFIDGKPVGPVLPE